jgi:hypothetical protein
MRNTSIYKVSKNTGMNPVERAIAKQKFNASITNMRIALFMLDEGEECLSDFASIQVIVNALMFAMVATGKDDSPEYRKLRSAWRITYDGIKLARPWVKSYAVTLDNALEIASTEWAKVPPKIASDCVQLSLAGKSALDAIAA